MTDEGFELTDEHRQTALGKALERLVTDEAFARSVADDPDAALGDYRLAMVEREALSRDARRLSTDEVTGFSLDLLDSSWLLSLPGPKRMDMAVWTDEEFAAHWPAGSATPPR